MLIPNIRESITHCLREDCYCFGCVTATGACKYEMCLHDDPKWQEQQRIIERKRSQMNG